MNLSNNALSVIALANEYCQAAEMAAEVSPAEFTGKMVRLLPRIYIAVSDLPEKADSDADFGFDARHLDEAYYEEIRQSIAATLGERDAYLDTFQQDMQYSDTPIAATVSEGLADIFQVLYNFVEDVRNSDTDQAQCHLADLKVQFAEYWSETLCNVMRPLNQIIHNPDEDFE